MSADAMEKRCRRCGLVKPLDAFGHSNRDADGHTSMCRLCKAEYDLERLWDPAKRGRYRQLHRDWYTRNRQRILAKTRADNEELRTQVLLAYGHRCQCCGEETREFLGVDHINGGGSRHRCTTTGEGRNFYLWLKRQGFPRDEFRLLCHNCNIARGHHGYCPHERSEDHSYE